MGRILVADDDRGILEVIKIILEENGHEVIALDDGSVLVDKAREMMPDIILLDIWMSGIDGRQVAKKLKSNKETSRIPIIIISALSDLGQIVKESCADDFISKPFDIDNFTKTIDKYLKDA